jgi:hypothetical protein
MLRLEGRRTAAKSPAREKVCTFPGSHPESLTPIPRVKGDLSLSVSVRAGKLTTHLPLVSRLKYVEVYLQFPICLQEAHTDKFAFAL